MSTAPATGRHRHFERKSVKIDDRFVPAFHFACAGCGASHDMIDRGNPLPPDIVRKKMGQKNWTLGDSEAEDYCPSCTESAVVARRIKKRSTPTLVTNDGETLVKAPAPVLQPIPTAQREDNQAIFLKLNEVYDASAKKYKGDLRDVSLAAIMNYPVEWITSIREQFFGPEGPDPAIAALEVEIDTLDMEVQQLQADQKAIRTEVAEILTRLNKTDGAIAQARQRLEEIKAKRL